MRGIIIGCAAALLAVGLASSAHAQIALQLQNATADYEQATFEAPNAIDGTTATGWAIAGGAGSDHALIVETRDDFSSVEEVTFRLEQVTFQHILGKLRISYTTDPRGAFSSWIPLDSAVGSFQDTVGNWSCVSEASSVWFCSAVVSPSDTATYEFRYPLVASNITGFKIEALSDARLPLSGPGTFGSNGNFVLSELTVFGNPNVSTYTGADVGEGLDLDGTFVFAVDTGRGLLTSDPSTSIIRSATFQDDQVVAGYSSDAAAVSPFAVPSIGSSSADDELELMMSTQPHTGVSGGNMTTTLSGLTVGHGYKLQLIWYEGCCDRAFDVFFDGTQIVDDVTFPTIGTQKLATHSFIAASTSSSILFDGAAVTVAGLTDHNPIINALTLEDTTPVAWAPTSYDFAQVQVGDSSIQQSFTLSNPSGASVDVTGISITGTGSSQFTVDYDTCGDDQPTIGAGSSCNILVTFEPTSTSGSPFSVTLAAATDGGTDAVTLTAEALPPTADVDTELVFPPTPINTSSAAQNLVINNDGVGNLVVSSVTVVGAGASQYTVTAGSCGSLLPTVLPGSFCALSVTFRPTSNTGGPITASVVIVSNSGTDAITLTGNVLQSIPTLSEWGMLLMFVLLAATMLLRLRNPRTPR